jgi:hypothetical protein
MYNPETQETLGTGHRTDNKQTKHTTQKKAVSVFANFVMIFSFLYWSTNEHVDI